MAEDYKGMTNKELLRMIMHRIESLDERERILQRKMERLLGREEVKEKTGEKWSREKAVLIGWTLTAVLFFVEIILRVMGI